jgi:hypothetical protein
MSLYTSDSVHAEQRGSDVSSAFDFQKEKREESLLPLVCLALLQGENVVGSFCSFD